MDGLVGSTFIVAVFLLAGNAVHFDGAGGPQFSPAQLSGTSPSTREGLARWAATPHGREIVRWFEGPEYVIDVTEDGGEEGMGRAPQPGIATLIAATDHARRKTYELVLNPRFFRMPEGMTPLPNQISTPADMMAAAWAGEMLHIYFYARGVSLPHHDRVDFQSEWRAVAGELGMPMLTHDDQDERAPGRARVILLRRPRYAIR